MKTKINKLFHISTLALSLVAIVPVGFASTAMWEHKLTAGFNAHIDFFTALYLVEKRKAVQTPCIIQFVQAVKKEIQNPEHNAPFLSERGEQLIRQLERMWLNSYGRFLIAKYRDEGKDLFLNLLFSKLS